MARVEYAMHKGNKFIDLGTIDYLAKKMQNGKPMTKYTALVHMMLREQKRQQNGEKYTAI